MTKEVAEYNKVEKKNNSLKNIFLLLGVFFLVRMIDDFLNKPKEYIPTQDYTKKDESEPVTIIQ